MSNYTQDQLVEIEKILNFIEKMEGITRTSTSPEQVERVKKQIGQYASKLTALMPHVDRNKINVNAIRSELGLADLATSAAGAAAASGGGGGGNLLTKFPQEPASPNSTDRDVNFTATVVKVIQREYWPIVTDQHCKLDFSHASERDALLNHMEASLRNLKVLAETIEEYATAEHQDFREQLLKMKNKQTRIFLFETNDALKKIRDFLRKLVRDVEMKGNVVMNKQDVIKFNARFESATALEGYPLHRGLREFENYVSQAIEELNLPQLKI